MRKIALIAIRAIAIFLIYEQEDIEKKAGL